MQLEVLKLLEDHRSKPHDDEGDTYLTVFELADAMTRDARRPAVSLVESIRRAVKRLAAEGVIELATVSVSRDVQGSERSVPKRMLAARIGGAR